MESIKLIELIKKAKEAYQRNDFKNASLVLNEIIENDPNATEAFFLLANIFHMRGELGKAIKAFQRVLELDPQHTDASISLSVLLNDIGRYEEAKNIFDKANQHVKLSPQNGLAEPHVNKKFALKHFELAELYASYSRYDEALFEYNKAIALDTENLEVRIKVAKCYSKKGFLSKAVEELKRLKTENPGYLPARMALGLLYYGSGNVIEAQSEWQGVLSRDPKHQEATMYLNLSKGATETLISI